MKKKSKKIPAAILSLSMLLPTISTYAAERNVTKQQLDAGVYTVSATVSADKVGAYLYGDGTGYTKASTSIPRGSKVKVTVPSVRHEGGELEVGIVSEDGVNISVDGEISVTKTDKPTTFYQGGDITETNYIEDLGGKYFDRNGKEGEGIKILAQHGVNMARIRLTNHPGKGYGDGNYYLPEGYQDEADCLDLAKRAKAEGMGIQFTFNYSDYWSNGERQIVPAEWVAAVRTDLGYNIKDAAFLNSMSAAQKTQIQNKLGDLIYDYTLDIMTKLKNQGTVPKYVSLGNEINGGVLFPFGNSYAAKMDKNDFELEFDNAVINANPSNYITCNMDWKGMANMLNRGYDAVKAVSPESQVIIHLAEGSKDSTFTWFFDNYKKAGGKFDVIGASYYPAWSENVVATCVNFCNNISAKYNKDIMIMETGYNWNATRKDGYAGQLADIDAYKNIYPPTQEGHAGYMAELINGLKSVKGGRCVGYLYWDPMMIHVEGETENSSLSGWAYRESDDKVDVNVVENTTLFDFEGKAIRSLDIMKMTQNSIKDTPAPKPTPAQPPKPTPASKPFEITDKSAKDGVFTCNIKNNTQETKKLSAYLAAYDENGALVKVSVTKVDAAAMSETPVSLECANSNSRRLYLWDGLVPVMFAENVD